MNKLKEGSGVFQVLSGDGKAKPEYYTIEKVGTVERISKDPQMIKWGWTMIFGHSEEQFLKPNNDGFCYYFAHLPEMDSKYQKDINGNYKVPTADLKAHMLTYESPWVEPSVVEGVK